MFNVEFRDDKVGVDDYFLLDPLDEEDYEVFTIKD